MLQNSGFEAQTVSELRRKGVADSDQLRYAVENGFAILTHNRGDFQKLAMEYFEAGHEHFGIIISVLRSPQQISKAAIRMLELYSADEIKNQVIYI